MSALRPEDEAAWSAYLRHHPEATLFHTLGWRSAVHQTFGHEPHYFVAKRRSEIAGVLPLFLVKSLIGGRMLVSVPYGVGGGILAGGLGMGCSQNEAREADVASGLLEAAVATAMRHRCRCIDFRSEVAAFGELPIIEDHVNFRRELPDRPEDVPDWLPRKARAAARNGRDRFGLTIGYGAENLKEVWRLYAVNMRRLGSVCYPFRFFRALHDAMPSATWVSLIRRGREPVAGLVTFVFKNAVLPYFYGANASAQSCSAANYIYYSLAQRAVEHGYRVFDFGRTRRDNRGSFDFKRFHGFEPRPLEYQRYTLCGKDAPNLNPANPAFMAARRLWRRLPLWFTKAAGSRLAKHIPG